DSRAFVIAVKPLLAASSVLMPLDMLSIRAFRSPARLLSDEAVKKLVGLSRAEFTFLPVARRSCVFDIRSAVFCNDSRLVRTAFDRVISDIVPTSCGRLGDSHLQLRNYLDS